MDPAAVHAAAFHALNRQDAAEFREILSLNPELKRRINEPLPDGFGTPPLFFARTPAMVDLFIEAGADLNVKSRWWAGGFGFLHTADPELAEYAIQRGAVVDTHAAARLDKLETLADLVRKDPSRVHARGGDGQTPLHFAASVEIAGFLLAHGADIDATDLDHESTPAQWMLDTRQEIVRWLVNRGCRTDLLMAAALGDLPLAKRILETRPESIALRVNEECFPMQDGRAGGTIYQWTLGFHVSPHQVARKFHHLELLEFLIDRSPPAVQLINACWMDDEPLLKRVLSRHPAAPQGFSEADKRQLAHAARNNEMTAVQLMLEIGIPATIRGQHGGQPLHWACWHGNLAMVKAILKTKPPLEDASNDFNSSPLGWAMHGSQHGWHRNRGNYPEVVNALLSAGAAIPEREDGTEEVRAVLRRHQGGS